ncbi:S8/S53 family peptidase, partial [Flavobacterium aurantiibacter]
LHPEVTFYEFMTNKNESDNRGENLEDDNSGEVDNTQYDSFNLNQFWPTISTIIPPADFVGWNRGLHPSWQCMEYSKEQLRLAGFKISAYFSPGQTFQVYTAQNGVNLTQVTNSINYLRYALTNGIPVIVGVDNHSGSPNPLTDNTTDHFVVVVGMGQDSNGKYFRFFDNASGDVAKGTSYLNKLYYNPLTGIFSGTSQATPYSEGLTYTLTMVRKSKRL